MALESYVKPCRRYNKSEYFEVKKLFSNNIPICEIVRITQIPRGTIRTWCENNVKIRGERYGS